MTKSDYTLDDLNERIKGNLAKKCTIVLLVLIFFFNPSERVNHSKKYTIDMVYNLAFYCMN